MKQPDWASKKAAAMFACWWGSKRTTGDMVTRVAKLLRAERARAKKACQRIKAKGRASQLKHDIKLGIAMACDDCAAAVKGKP